MIFQAIKKFVMDMITEPDGVTICPVRVAFLLFSLAFIANACYVAFVAHTIDLVGFGTGGASLLGGGGLGVGAKTKFGSDAQPPVEQQPPGGTNV